MGRRRFRCLKQIEHRFIDLSSLEVFLRAYIILFSNIEGVACMEERDIQTEEIDEPLAGQVTLEEILAELRLS